MIFKHYRKQYVHGIKVICTAHGEKIEELKRNKNLIEILKDNFFEKIIFLKSKGKRGKIEKIYDNY